MVFGKKWRSSYHNQVHLQIHSWRQVSKQIARSFAPLDFQPAWVNNNHMQTLLGFVLPVATPFSYSWTYERERIDTRDGDFFHVDTLYPDDLETEEEGEKSGAVDATNAFTEALAIQQDKEEEMQSIEKAIKAVNKYVRTTMLFNPKIIDQMLTSVLGIQLYQPSSQEQPKTQSHQLKPDVPLISHINGRTGSIISENFSDRDYLDGIIQDLSVSSDSEQDSNKGEAVPEANHDVHDPVADATNLASTPTPSSRIQQADDIREEGSFHSTNSTPSRSKSGQVVVIIVPGTESSSYGPYNLRLANAIHEMGWTAKVVNFRGCSGQVNNTPRSYHLGFTEDLKVVVEKTAREVGPDGVIYMCGMSLGANVLLKFLGEMGNDILKYKVRGAAAACVPFDPYACHFVLNAGVSKAIYVANFLRTLKPKAIQMHRKNPDAFDLWKVLAATTIREYDEAMTVPVFGFESPEDYYRKSNVVPLLKNIAIPTLVMNAKDDPVMDPTCLPSKKDIGDAPIYFDYKSFGGHLGFVSEEVLNGNERHPFIARSFLSFLTHVHRFLHSTYSSSFAQALITVDELEYSGLRCLLEHTTDDETNQGARLPVANGMTERQLGKLNRKSSIIRSTSYETPRVQVFELNDPIYDEIC